MDNVFPVPLIQLTHQQLSQFGRIGATRLITVPALAAPVPASSPGTIAPLLTWRDPGTVIALYAQTLAGDTPSMASTALRLQFMGDEDFITNGNTGDFAPFLALVGPNANWFPMTRRVKRGDNWTITYRNQDAADPVVPSVMFTFIADSDLDRATRNTIAAG